MTPSYLRSLPEHELSSLVTRLSPPLRKSVLEFLDQQAASEAPAAAAPAEAAPATIIAVAGLAATAATAGGLLAAGEETPRAAPPRPLLPLPPPLQPQPRSAAAEHGLVRSAHERELPPPSAAIPSAITAVPPRRPPARSPARELIDGRRQATQQERMLKELGR